MKRESLLGWAAIVAFVTAYDVWAMRTHHQTLSSGFWSAVRHRTWRWVVGPVWALLTLHLFTGTP